MEFWVSLVQLTFHSVSRCYAGTKLLNRMGHQGSQKIWLISVYFNQQESSNFQRWIKVNNLFPFRCSCMKHHSVSLEKLLDEDNHLSFFDSAWFVFVECAENFIESFIREFISSSEVSKCVLNEFFGFILIKSTWVIDIVGGPNLINDALNCLFFRGYGWHFF